MTRVVSRLVTSGVAARVACALVACSTLGGLTGCNYLLWPEGQADPDAGASDAGSPVERDAGPPPVPDTTPPTVTLTTPTEDCLEGVVVFALVAKDEDSAVGLVSARFAGNDLVLSQVTDDNWSASFDTSPLFNGLHVLTVTAIDTANNLAELRRVFGHSADGEFVVGEGFTCGDAPDAGAPDSDDPVVEILTPPPSFDAYAGYDLPVSARATDDVGPLTVVATLNTDSFDTASVTLSGVTEIFSGTLDVSGVAEGIYPSDVTATDAADRSGSASRTVTIDRTLPTVTIVEPTGGQTRAAFTDVVALATDDRSLVSVTLYEQGEPDPLGVATSPTAEGRWGVIYRLPCAGLPREVTFEMVAHDSAGNKSSDAVTVTVDTTGCEG